MTTAARPTRDQKTFRDAVHHDIDFDRDEVRLINTREFQRLRRIKQLGLAYLVYPSATHTRFDHVLGTCHMAQRILDSLSRNGEKVSPEDGKMIRYLALLHDIGHLPFGHTLEDERPVIAEKHDGPERLNHFLFNTSIAREMEITEQDLGLPKLRDRIVAILCEAKEPSRRKSTRQLSTREAFYRDIVGNTVCADLLDYLKRDTFFTGIQHRYDDRIVSSFRTSDKDELFIDLTDDRTTRTGLISEILHLLRLRYTLGERVYYHRTKAAASAMIAKAVELAGFEAGDLYDLGDEELLFLLEHAELLPLAIPRLKNTLQAKIPQATVDACGRIASHIRRRRLYEPVFRITRAQADGKHEIDELVDRFHRITGVQGRCEIEDQLTKECGLASGQVIVYCPDGDMSGKEADVRVRFSPDGRLEVLKKVKDPHIADDIKALEAKHRSLWSLELFVDPDVKAEKGTRIALAFESRLRDLNRDLTNDIAEYRSDPGEIVSYHALCEAIKMTHGDFSVFPRVLEAAHEGGRMKLTTADKWIEAFPTYFAKSVAPSSEGHDKPTST
jgi:HD superfamily phosphohydrolase